MRIKLDENLPARLVNVLAHHGHDVDTVVDEGLAGEQDTVVWSEAQKARRFLITQDLDFSDVRRFRPGTHHGILLLRLQQPGRQALMRRIENLLIAEKMDDWQGCFVVATDRKIRVRRPPR